MIKYLNKRDKENLQIKIKFGFFEFYINASGENIAKKENDYFHNEHHKIHTKNTHLKKRAKKIITQCAVVETERIELLTS